MPIGDASHEVGLRSAQRVAPSLFWASWADALLMIHEKLPAVARTINHKLTDDVECDGCLGGLKRATAPFAGRPEWGSCRWECDRRQRTLSSQVSGHTDGNATRPPLLSTSSGGPWCWARLVLTCALIPATGRRSRWVGLRPTQSSEWNHTTSARWSSNEVTSVRGRGQMRVRGRFGQLGASPCGVSQVRQTAHQSVGTRNDTGQDFLGDAMPR